MRCTTVIGVASVLLAPTSAYIAPTAPPRGAVLRSGALHAPMRPNRVAQPQQQLALVRSRPIVAKAAIAQPTLVQRALVFLASLAAFVLGTARFAFAATKRSSGIAISGDVVKYGFIGGCVALSFVFKKEPTPNFIETPGAVAVDPETLKPPEPAQGAPAPAAAAPAPADFGEILADDSAVFGSLAARMQELANAPETPPENESRDEPPADETSWGNTAVLEPPRDGANEPRGVLDGEPAVEFPAGFPIIDGEVVEVERAPAEASADQLAMLNRMMGLSSDE